MEPPSFSTSGPQIVRAAPGSDASLVLPLPSGSPPFHFEWSRAGVKLEDRFKPSNDSSGVRLTISSVSTDDSGVYTLQASNAAGKDTTRVRLEVSPDEKPIGEDPPTFLRRLQDLTVKVGTRTRFLVEIVSSTECRVTWYRNERRLLEAERIALVRDGNFWCADISAVSVDDAGRWTCTAENVGGRASCSAHLNVLVPKAYKRPEFVEELRALLTEQGTVSLECKVVGVPTPVLRWFKDSREIKAGDVFALTANAEDPTSLGTYTCEAVNCMGRAYSSSKVHVIGRASREGSARPSSGGAALESPPIFTKELEDQFVRICEPLTLSCNIMVPPWPRSVVWYNKEGKIEPSEKYRVLEDGVGGYLLEIQSAEWPDEGEWKCVASSSGGRVGVTTCYISMDVPKNYRKPRFMENLQAVLTEEGLVSFECKVVGFPTPVLSWFKDGQELKPGDVYQLTGTNSLGSYCCIARNCMGQGSSSAELTVEDIQNQLNEEEKLQLFSKNQAPKFLQGLKSVEVKIDEPFRFMIKVAIPPDPTVLWYRDDQPVDESSRCHHGKEEHGVFFLDIQSLEFMDQAEWKCVAMNDFGHSVTSCFLKLIIPRHYKKPRFLENLQAILSEEGAVNLECKVIGVPQPVLKWYKDGEELKPGDIHRIISGQDGTCCLGTYTCEAQNCMGIAASSASLLGFEDSIKAKSTKKCEEQTLQRNLSLSTIHEERTSQMYDTPVGDITLDDKGEISFSFDGKEVSVSLYETPDLTEEEALQIVEMYADQLSENVTEHNVIELPPLRFVKETSTSGNLLMEAIIIDVSPEYFTSPEEDLRTEADVEDISIADENGAPQLSLDQDDIDNYLEQTIALLSDEKADLPKKLERKKSDSQKSVDDYFSLSRDQSLSEEKKDDDTQFLSESDLQSFASARSSGKPKSTKPSIEDGQESSDITKTVLIKEDFQNRQPGMDLKLTKNNKEQQSSRSSRRSSSSSERSLNRMKEEILEGKAESTLNKTVLNQSINTELTKIRVSLVKVINDVQMIERDIILQSELMSSAAMASRSLEIVNSLIRPLTEIHSITDAVSESLEASFLNKLPESLNMFHQSLKIIGKCIDLESDNKTLVKKTCMKIIDKCGEEFKKLNKEISTMVNKDSPFFEEIMITDINTKTAEIFTTITYSLDAIKDCKNATAETDAKFNKISPETIHLQKTQKAVYELKNPLKFLLCIVDEVYNSSSTGAENIINSQIILNDMSIPIQDLQNALEQIEFLSITEAQSNMLNFNTEIIETVMNSVLKLRTSFEQLSAETGEMEKIDVLNDVLSKIRHNISDISSHLDIFETKIGTYDILNSENKLEALQKMAQLLIHLENNLIILDVMPCTKIHMVEFHKCLTKVLEHVIESNDANKYFIFLEICDTIKRLNTLLKNMDSQDMTLSLAGISNNLKIIKSNIKEDVFTSDLNFSLSSIISDLLLSIRETIHHGEISTCTILTENVEDLSIKYLEKDKLNIVLEQIDRAVVTINFAATSEVAQDLALKKSLNKILPSLEEIKCCIASLNVNLAEKEENISNMSNQSFPLTVANPLCDLNENISVLNQVIYERVKECSENVSIKTELVIPLLDLRNALEVLQQDVISQYGENITYFNINGSIADAIQNIQSCILLVEGHDLLEIVDEMSTLDDISAIKTAADIVESDNFASPMVTEKSIKINSPIMQNTSAQMLSLLNEQLLKLQCSKSIDALDSLSEDYYCSTIKPVMDELDRVHNIIEGFLHPIQFEEHETLPNFINSTQVAMIINPLQELHKSLSLIDIRNISMENQSQIDEIDVFSQNICSCEMFLNDYLNIINMAVETVEKISEISMKVHTLQKLCLGLSISLNATKTGSQKYFSGLIVLEDAISQMLNTINHSKHFDILKLKTSIENLHQCVITKQDVAIGFTVKSPILLDSETRILSSIDNIERTTVTLSQLQFVSELPAYVPPVATKIKLGVLDKIEGISETTDAILQNLPKHVPHDNLISTKDFIKIFYNETILLSCLIKRTPDLKRAIKILQVFYDLRQNFRQFQIYTQDLYVSEDFNKWIIDAEECLVHIQTLLVDNLDLFSELIIDIPCSNIENNEFILNKILESNDFTNLHHLSKLLLTTIKSFKPSLIKIHGDIAKELEFSNIDLETDRETVETYNLLSNYVSERIFTEELKDQQYFKVLFKIIQNYDDCKDALGSGRKIIFMKCISDCLDALKNHFIVETKDTEFVEVSISNEYNLKDVLMELTDPIESLNQKLINICNSNEINHLLNETESSIEFHLRTIDEFTKKIKEYVQCKNPCLDNFTITLVKDLNNKINLILKSSIYLKNLQNCSNLIFMNEPIKELQSILNSILSEVIIVEEHKQLKEKTDSFSQHMDYYIEIIETVEEVSALIKLDELKQSANIVRELRERFFCTEPFCDITMEVTDNQSDKMKLLTNLQEALTSLQVQVFEREQELSGLNQNTREGMIKAITNLQDDLETLANTSFIFERPEFVTDNLESEDHHPNNCQISIHHGNEIIGPNISKPHTFQNVQYADVDSGELQIKKPCELSADITSQPNVVEILQVDETFTNIVSKNEISAENQPIKNDLLKLEISQLNSDVHEIYATVGVDLEQKAITETLNLKPMIDEAKNQEIMNESLNSEESTETKLATLPYTNEKITDVNNDNIEKVIVVENEEEVVQNILKQNENTKQKNCSVEVIKTIESCSTNEDNVNECLQNVEETLNLKPMIDEAKNQEIMNESLNSEESTETKLAKLPYTNEKITDVNNDNIEKVIVVENEEEVVKNILKQNENTIQKNCSVEVIKTIESCSTNKDNVNECLQNVEDFIAHEQQSVAIHDLEILLQEINDTIDLSINYPVIQKSEILQNTLDEVQTIIMKLKFHFDGSINNVLNDVLEDLECNVRSVKLQINEQCSPSLIKEACANLQSLVTYLGTINNTENMSPKALSKNSIHKCEEDVEEVIELLENVPCLNINSQLDSIMIGLSDIKNTMKLLKSSLSVDAEFLIIGEIEVLQNLNYVEDKVFSLEKQLDDIDIISKDGIIAVIHSIYGCICNMRGTLFGIQKKYMYENYGQPSRYFLKSIKNVNVMSTYDPKAEWQQLSRSLRNVLNHFEDIKFYINFDKTARLPSDSAFTKVILGELNTTLSEVIMPNVEHLNKKLSEQVKDVINCVNTNLQKIENKTSLEVKEKIPIFKELSVKMIDLTENLKTMYKDFSEIKNQLTDAIELSKIENEKLVVSVEMNDLTTKHEFDGTKEIAVLDYQRIEEKRELVEQEKYIESIVTENVEVLENVKIALDRINFDIQKDRVENDNSLDLGSNKSRPGGENFYQKCSDEITQNFPDVQNQKEQEKELTIDKKDDDNENDNFMSKENLEMQNICNRKIKYEIDENNISSENICVKADSIEQVKNEIEQNCEQNIRDTKAENDEKHKRHKQNHLLETDLINHHTFSEILNNMDLTTNNENDFNTTMNLDNISTQQSEQEEKYVIQQPEQIMVILQRESTPLQSDININEAVVKVFNEEEELIKNVNVCSTKICSDAISSKNGKSQEKLIILDENKYEIQSVEPLQMSDEPNFDHNDNIENAIFQHEINVTDKCLEDYDELSTLAEMQNKKYIVEAILDPQNIVEPKNAKVDCNSTEIDITNVSTGSDLLEKELNMREFCEIVKDNDQSDIKEAELKGRKGNYSDVERYDIKDEPIKKENEENQNDKIICEQIIKTGKDVHELTNENKNFEVSELSQALQLKDVTQSLFIDERQVMLEKTEKLKNIIGDSIGIQNESDGNYVSDEGIYTEIVLTEEHEKGYGNKDQTNVNVDGVTKEEKIDATETVVDVCQVEDLCTIQDEGTHKLDKGNGKKPKLNNAEKFNDNSEIITEVDIVSDFMEIYQNSTDVVQDKSEGKQNQEVPCTKNISSEDLKNSIKESDGPLKNEAVYGDNLEILKKIGKYEEDKLGPQNEIVFCENEFKLHEEWEMTEYFNTEEVLNENTISSPEIGLIKDVAVTIQNMSYEKFDVIINELLICQDKIIEKPSTSCEESVTKSVNLQKTVLHENNFENLNKKEWKTQAKTLICLQQDSNESNNIQFDNKAAEMTVQELPLQAKTEITNDEIESGSAVCHSKIQNILNKVSEKKSDVLISQREDTEKIEIPDYDKLEIQSSEQTIYEEVNQISENTKKSENKNIEFVCEMKFPMTKQDESPISMPEKQNGKLENSMFTKQAQNVPIEKDAEDETEISQSTDIKKLLELADHDQEPHPLTKNRYEMTKIETAFSKELSQNSKKENETEDEEKQLIYHEPNIESNVISECEKNALETMEQKKQCQCKSEKQSKNNKMNITIQKNESEDNRYKNALKDQTEATINQDSSFYEKETGHTKNSATKNDCQKEISNNKIPESKMETLNCQDQDNKKIESSEYEKISISMTIQDDILDSIKENKKDINEEANNKEVNRKVINEKKLKENTKKVISRDKNIPKVDSSEHEKSVIPAGSQDESLQPIITKQNAKNELKIAMIYNESHDISNEKELEQKMETRTCQNKNIETIANQVIINDGVVQFSSEEMKSEMQEVISNELYQEIPSNQERKDEQEKLVRLDIDIKNENEKTIDNNQSQKENIKLQNAAKVVENQEFIGKNEPKEIQVSLNIEKADILEKSYENMTVQTAAEDAVIYFKRETQKGNNNLEDVVVKNDKEELTNKVELEDKQKIALCHEKIKEITVVENEQARSDSQNEQQPKKDMHNDEKLGQNIIRQRTDIVQNNREINTSKHDEDEDVKKELNYELQKQLQGTNTKTMKVMKKKSKEKKEMSKQKGSKDINHEDPQLVVDNRIVQFSDNKTTEKRDGVGYNERYEKIDMDNVAKAYQEELSTIHIDRSNKQEDEKIYVDRQKTPEKTFEYEIENQTQIKFTKETKESIVEKEEEHQNILKVNKYKDKFRDQKSLEKAVLESKDVEDSQINNEVYMCKTNDQGILKSVESVRNTPFTNEKLPSELYSIHKMNTTKDQEADMLTEGFNFKCEEIISADISKIDVSSKQESKVVESNEITYPDKDRTLFVNRNDANSSLEFLRPSGYNAKSFGYADSLPQMTTNNKSTVIYKAQSLLHESQIKFIPPYCDQHSIIEPGSESTQKPTKTTSESRSSTVSERRAGFHRDLKRKPAFSTHLTDRTAVESSRVKLTCSILCSTVPVISWYKNGILLDDKQKCKIKYMDGLITLEILNAVPSDSGEYSCTVENENGSITSSAILKVYPSFEASPIPPTFTRSIRDVYHLHENELVLECRIRGQPLPTITWLKDNTAITQGERYQAHYLADGVCRLTIVSPNEDDSGTYTCKAENSIWSDKITHDVHFIRNERNKNISTSENKHEFRRPHFSNVLSDHKVVSGGTIGLQVQISGSPTRVEWLREGRSVIDTYRNAQTYVDRGLYTLALSDVTEKESGLYTCRAWNIHGTVDMNASITVVHPNQFEGKPATIISRPVKDLLITIGEDLNISFRVQGDPKPKVFFMKGIRDITGSQRVCKMTSDDYVKFTLKRSVVSDAGTYCVLAKNVYGCDRAFVTVVIRQRASSDNLISDWIYPVDDLAISIVDRNYKSVPDRIPNEPSAVDGGNNWVSLAWSKPDSQSKAPILAYKVESWLLGKEGGARWIELGVTPRNSFDAFNLKQGEEYHFRVTPRNRYGWGESVQTSMPIGIGLAGDRPEFVEILPGQLKVLVGEPAVLSCSFKGKPNPEIIWMKNGHEIEEELNRVKLELSENNTSLRINNIKIEDEGRYSCEATNVHGRSSTYSRMAVITDRQVWAADAKLKRERSAGTNGDYPPQFTMRLRDRRVQATYPVRLTCQVIGNPPPTVTWFKNTEEVSVDSRHIASQDEYFYTLEIAPTTLDDAGVYEALARNGSGAISCRCNLVVDKGIRAYIAPEFCCGFEPLYSVCEGDELRISAVVEAYPTVGVTWYRDGVRLRPSRRAVMTLDHDGQTELAVASVTARDAGVYTCTASNEVGRASTSGKVQIIKGDHEAETLKVPPIVISPDVPYSKEPMFIRKPRSSEAREGDTVIIECEVIGDPKPDVYWLRDFLKPDYYRDASHFKRVGAGPEYRFEIPHAKFDYTGAYSIVAKNMHGEAKAIISLQILAKDLSSSDETHNIRYGRVEIIPRFDKDLTDLLCYDGDAIEFECSVSGNPEPDIRWFHYNEILAECSDFETSYNLGTARLKINQVTVEDEGTYTCEASNNMGKATSSACLVIYPPGEPNTLSQRLRRPPALLSASSTPRSTPRTTPARSLSRTPGPELSRLCSPSHEIAPKFYTYPYNKVVEEGDTVVFQCAVRGLPAPWTTWDKDGIIITPSARISIKEKDEMFRILEIEEVTVEDVGLYRIILENDYGRAEASARLEVISQAGKFYGTRSYSVSPRKCLPYRRRTPSFTRQD